MNLQHIRTGYETLETHVLLKIVLVANSLVLALPSVAQTTPTATTPTTTTPAPNQAKPRKPKKLCRVEGMTGSHFSNSVCRTAEEWDEIDGRAAVDIDSIRSSSKSR
jgi:hypothetical protein